MKTEQIFLDLSAFDSMETEQRSIVKPGAYYALKAILDILNLPAGSPLPYDRKQLSQMLNVKPSNIRDALQKLGREGFITNQPRYGTRIAEKPTPKVHEVEKQPDSLIRMLNIAKESDIEGAAIAASYAGGLREKIDTALRNWEYALTNPTELPRPLALFIADTALHRQIRTVPIGGEGFGSLYSPAKAAGDLGFLGAASLLARSYEVPNVLEQFTQDHQAIVAAIDRVDIDRAKASMTAHYDHIYSALQIPGK